MPIALSCTCGVRLEIDDQFAGQTIHCPDCHKSIAVPKPKVGPILTSGYALSSLLLGLVGLFTFVGAIAAIALGLMAKYHLRISKNLAGVRFANAGLLMGILGVALSAAAYFSPNVFQIDAIFRELEWQPRLDFASDRLFDAKASKGFALERSSQNWGVYKHATGQRTDVYDDLILMDPRQDAQVAVMSIEVFDHETPDVQFERAIKRFKESELVAVLSRSKAKLPKLEPRITEHLKEALPDRDLQNAVIEVPLGGQNRKFAIRVIKRKGLFKIFVLVAGARSSRFDSALPELKAMMNSFQMEP